MTVCIRTFESTLCIFVILASLKIVLAKSLKSLFSVFSLEKYMLLMESNGNLLSKVVLSERFEWDIFTAAGVTVTCHFKLYYRRGLSRLTSLRRWFRDEYEIRVLLIGLKKSKMME